MRMSQEDKDRSHARIIASAAKLARQRGVDGTSVGDVMQDAGMTHGGFYKHFASKEDMLAAALDHAFDESTARLRPELGTEQAEQITAAFKAFYLSDLHLGMPSLGCPIAALAGDIAREGEGLKGRFGHGVRRMIELLTRGTVGSERARRARATRNLALMVGAVVIARSCDPQTAQLVLEACRAPTKA